MKKILFLFFLASFCSTTQAQITKRDSIAITKAIAYLQDTATRIDIPDYLVYDLLRRTHHLPAIRSRQYIDTLCNGNEANFCKYYHFLRLIDAETLPLQQNKLHIYRETDSITIQALWADKLTLNENYLLLLECLSKKGKYELTHAYLSLIWLKENNHWLVKTPYYATLENTFKTKMIAILTNRFGNYWLDIHSEILALLLYDGIDQENIKLTWINSMLNAQQKNGGWYYSLLNNETTAHSTVLALWALFAYTNTNKINYTWICH